MISNSNISTLIISNADNFVNMKDDWDQQLQNHIEDPFFSSYMIAEHWKLGSKLGWNPFLLVFLSDDRIIGFAPLLLRQKFGLKKVSNFDHYTCPDFIFDDYRSDCIRILIKYLFGKLKCNSADITFMQDSANHLTFERICNNYNLKLNQGPQEGQAIIPVQTSLELFKKSLKKKHRKRFRIIQRKLENFGSWETSCFELNSNSLKMIWDIENHSWKMRLKGEQQAIKDWGLKSILEGLQKSQYSKWSFETEVWFLNLNNKPIAYLLTFKRNKTVFFAKTSYDLRFKSVAPGIFLINNLIEQIFKNNFYDKIDFYSNLPFTRFWKPVVLDRVTLSVQKNSFISKIPELYFENRISKKFFRYIDNIKWMKH